MLEIDWVRIGNKINTDVKYCHAFCVTNFYKLYEIFNFFYSEIFWKHYFWQERGKKKSLWRKKKEYIEINFAESADGHAIIPSGLIYV